MSVEKWWQNLARFPKSENGDMSQPIRRQRSASSRVRMPAQTSIKKVDQQLCQKWPLRQIPNNRFPTTKAWLWTRKSHYIKKKETEYHWYHFSQLKTYRPGIKLTLNTKPSRNIHPPITEVLKQYMFKWQSSSTIKMYITEYNTKPFVGHRRAITAKIHKVHYRLQMHNF